MTELSSINSESTNRESTKRTVFTEEFMGRVNSLLGKYPDETEIIDFYIRSEKTARGRERHFQQEVRYHNLLIRPPSEWVAFFNSLETYQRGPVVDVMAQILGAGYETFGQIRNASIEEIANKQPKGGIRLIGQKRAGTIKRIFKSVDPPQS